MSLTVYPNLYSFALLPIHHAASNGFLWYALGDFFFYFFLFVKLSVRLSPSIQYFFHYLAQEQVGPVSYNIQLFYIIQ